MWFFLGGIAGALLGGFLPATIPQALSPYLAAAILSCLDAALFALRAERDGSFSARASAARWIAALSLAALLTYLGILIDAPLGTAANAALALMIFMNLPGQYDRLAAKN